MAVIIGSARHDEHGNCYSGGKAGDQTGQEVSTQKFYNHSKGWNVLRAKDNKVAEKLAEAMKIACGNKNIGYDQSERYGVIKHGINTKVKTECDCSSLVRACIIHASGKDVGDFNTANERIILLKSGLFTDAGSYRIGELLYNGDILVTRTKGHTAIVVSGAKKNASKYYSLYPTCQRYTFACIGKSELSASMTSEHIFLNLINCLAKVRYVFHCTKLPTRKKVP